MFEPRAPHILIMDETPEVLALLRELLEDERYRVTSSPTLMDSESIMALAPDAIIQDMFSGKAPGDVWRHLQGLREEPALSQIPLVLCTTMTQTVADEALATYLDHLAIHVVLKPFAVVDLLEVLASTLDRAGPVAQRAQQDVRDGKYLRIAF
jgi:CheY-like chemotaxis protein